MYFSYLTYIALTDSILLFLEPQISSVMDTQLQDLYVNEGLLGKGAYGVVYRYGFYGFNALFTLYTRNSNVYVYLYRFRRKRNVESARSAQAKEQPSQVAVKVLPIKTGNKKRLVQTVKFYIKLLFQL